LIVWVTSIAPVTGTYWLVHHNLAVGVEITSTRAWIYTFLISTGMVISTVWIYGTLWSTNIEWVAKVTCDTSTLPSTNRNALCISSAGIWLAWYLDLSNWIDWRLSWK